MKTRSTWQGCWTAPLKSNSVQRPQLASVSRFFEPYSEAAQELRIRAADRMGARDRWGPERGPEDRRATVRPGMPD